MEFIALILWHGAPWLPCTQTFWCGPTSNSSFQVILTNLHVISCCFSLLRLLYIYISLNSLHIKYKATLKHIMGSYQKHLLRLPLFPGLPSIQFLIGYSIMYRVQCEQVLTVCCKHCNQAVDRCRKAWKWVSQRMTTLCSL